IGVLAVLAVLALLALLLEHEVGLEMEAGDHVLRLALLATLASAAAALARALLGGGLILAGGVRPLRGQTLSTIELRLALDLGAGGRRGLLVGGGGRLPRVP